MDRRQAQIARLLTAVSVLSVSLGIAQAEERSAGSPAANTLKTNSQVGQYLRKKLPGRMKSGTLTVTRAAPAGGDAVVSPGAGQYTRKKLPGRMKSGTLTITKTPPAGGVPPGPKPK